jgi:hypothetical protein
MLVVAEAIGVAAVVAEAEDRRTDWESDGNRWIVPSSQAGSSDVFSA